MGKKCIRELGGILEKVHDNSDAFGPFPVSVLWLISNNCNLNCKHCSVFGTPLVRKSELDTETVLLILHKLYKSLKIRDLQLLGGEPLLRSDIKIIIEWANQNDINISIVTNVKIIDYDFLKFIKDNNLSNITFRIDGITEGSYGRVRCPGIFHKVVENLNKTIKFKHPETKILVNYVLTKVNMFQPTEIIKFFDTIGVDLLYLDILEITGNALKNKDQLFVQPMSYFKFFDDLYQNYPSCKMEIIPEITPIIVDYFNRKYKLKNPIPYVGCPALTSQFWLLADGLYTPCDPFYRNENLKKILNENTYSLLEKDIEDILADDSIKKLILMKKNLNYNRYYPCNRCKYLGNFCQPCIIPALLNQDYNNSLCSIAMNRIKGI